MPSYTIPVLGLILTFSIFLVNVIFKTGHLTARIEELEKWRIGIRQDMHEISDRLEDMNTSLKQLAVLIEERTERRNTITRA